MKYSHRNLAIALCLFYPATLYAAEPEAVSGAPVDASPIVASEPAADTKAAPTTEPVAPTAPAAPVAPDIVTPTVTDPAAPAIEETATDKTKREAAEAKAKNDRLRKERIEMFSGDAAKAVTDDSPLIKAIMAKDIAAVRKVIAEGADVNKQTDDDSYPIIVATIHADVEIMKVLTANGVDTTVLDNFKRSGLHYAAMQGEKTKADLLNVLEASVAQLDELGYSPLFYAYLNDKVDMAEFFIERMGATVNQANDSGELVAADVVPYISVKAAEHMVKHELNVFKMNANRQTLIDIARNSGNLPVVEVLEKAREQKLNEFKQKHQVPSTGTTPQGNHEQF